MIEDITSRILEGYEEEYLASHARWTPLINSGEAQKILLAARRTNDGPCSSGTIFESRTSIVTPGDKFF